MYIILSYRQEWSEYYRGEREDGNCEDLEFKNCEDEASIIKYFSERLFQDTKAPYFNYIFENFEDLVKVADTSFNSSTGNESVESIQFPDYYDYEYNRKLLIDRIKAAVTNNLRKLKDEKKLKEQEAKDLKIKEQSGAQLKIDRAQLEALAKQFGVKL